MNILLTGSTGLIGTALTRHLQTLGHTIYPLYRNPSTEKSHYWHPEENQIHLDDEIKLDAVIHLAGETIADSRWSQKKKDRILNSRVHGTRLLAEAISALKHRPELLISGSAIGYYGDTDDNIVDENSARGEGFLSDVATQWETATQAAEDAGIRTIHLRTGIVLSPEGGVLQKMLFPFSLGLGGVVGNGQQYMSWISIDDVVGVITAMLNNDQMTGAYNLVSPKPVTNYAFTKSLGSALHRPTVSPLPAFMARIMFGEMADALLLSSSRVATTRLKSTEYTFADIDLTETLTRLLDKNNKITGSNQP
jgi:uncharacterized protein (TIGR01777 family)